MARDRRPLFGRGKANAKTAKGLKLADVETLILNLAPHTSGGGRSLCSHASPDCIKLCLNESGRSYRTGRMARRILAARARKTREYLADPAAFIDRLSHEIDLAKQRRACTGQAFVVRSNGTSDQPRIGMELAARHPDVMMYDYTKIPRPWLRQRPNYRLTFSLSETNHAAAFEALAHGVNVAVIFDTKRGQALPTTFYGTRVVDGDETDLRYLDETDPGEPGIIIGLRAKGRAAKESFAMVVKVADLPATDRQACAA